MYVYSTYNVAIISPSSGFLRDELHGSPPPLRRSLQRMGSKAATAASSLTASLAPRHTPLPQRCAAAAVACGARAHAATALPQRSPAYNCALQAAAAVGLQFIARLRPIVLQFRGVSHSSYLAAADLNDLLSPFKVSLFLRLLSKQTPATTTIAQERDSV